jgi:hypothetical protein
VKAPKPLQPLQQLQLTPLREFAIKSCLKAWLEFDPDRLYSQAFECSAVDMLGRLLQDADLMNDFLSQHYRSRPGSRELKTNQVRYVVLHWLADLACGLGRY